MPRLPAKHPCSRHAVSNLHTDITEASCLHPGQFYECLNMASLYKLPIIFVVENNLWAIGMNHPRATGMSDPNDSEPHIWKKGPAFGMPGVLVDGMDVQKVSTYCISSQTSCISQQNSYIIMPQMAHMPVRTEPFTGEQGPLVGMGTQHAHPEVLFFLAPALVCGCEIWADMLLGDSTITLMSAAQSGWCQDRGEAEGPWYGIILDGQHEVMQGLGHTPDQTEHPENLSLQVAQPGLHCACACSAPPVDPDG